MPARAQAVWRHPNAADFVRAKWTMIALSAFVFLLLLYGTRYARGVDWLREHGIKEDATVLSTRNTLRRSWWGIAHPDGEVTFLYEAAGKLHTVSARVSTFQLSRLHRGDQFAVWYDPSHPEILATSWPSSINDSAHRPVGILVLLLLTISGLLMLPRRAVA